MPTTTASTTDPDVIASEFEQLSGVFLDGTDPADMVDFRATLARSAEFGGSSADADLEAWLAGEEV
jgi:hypothetical protein